jgi:hypothetical protein
MPNGFRRSARVEIEYHRSFGDFGCVIGGCPVDSRTPIPFIVGDARCMCTNPNARKRLRSGIRRRSCVRRRITTRFPRCAQQIPIYRPIRLRHFIRARFHRANRFRRWWFVMGHIRARQTITLRHDQRVFVGRLLIEFNEHTRQRCNAYQFILLLVRNDMPVPGLHGPNIKVVRYFRGVTRHQQRRCLRIQCMQFGHRDATTK